MKENYSYNQFSKSLIRHNVLNYAVELLTSRRQEAACVARNYVRNLYDYFVYNEDDSDNKKHALKICYDNIRSWEKLHDSNVGIKRPEDLTVCYLCGPEPNNDFKEMVSLGILPQNIWAFETDKSTYEKAIKSFGQNIIPQPHILKQNIETFFSNTPKKFDIIYIDACGSVASEKHALRCVTSACLHHRLCSPGIIISNFSEPDNKEDYYNMIQDYLFSKTYIGAKCNFDDWSTKKENIKLNSQNFYEKYGEFISCVLRDIPGIIVPLQRLWRNTYLEQIIQKNKIETMKINEELFNCTESHSMAKYFLLGEILNTQDFRKEQFKKELINFSDFLNGLKTTLTLQSKGDTVLKPDIQEIKAAFENSKRYQFLDKHHSNVLFDVITNQLSYPLHCNTKCCVRYRYKAKANYMFTDVTVFDECRYIYDWLPSIHQIESMYNNESWQYIFRFALDGLVKSRKLYNNEFFFQSSVVSESERGFETQKLSDRIVIEEC